MLASVSERTPGAGPGTVRAAHALRARGAAGVRIGVAVFQAFPMLTAVEVGRFARAATGASAAAH